MRARKNIKTWIGKIKNNKEIVLINVLGILYGILMAISIKIQEDIVSYICQVIFCILLGWVGMLVLMYYTILALSQLTKNVKNTTILVIVATISAIITYMQSSNMSGIISEIDKLILVIIATILSVFFTALILDITYCIINVKKWKETYGYSSKKR